jgi:hypothetical protein
MARLWPRLWPGYGRVDRPTGTALPGVPQEIAWVRSPPVRQAAGANPKEARVGDESPCLFFNSEALHRRAEELAPGLGACTADGFSRVLAGEDRWRSA